jgi:SAM-dependent methyltransferase
MTDVGNGVAVPRVLFANYSVPNCGVHQYGRNLYSVLRPSKDVRFDYLDIEAIGQLDEAVQRNGYAALLVNYHPFTLTFTRPDDARRYPIPCVAIMHEMTQAEADAIPRRFFQYYVMGDPTLRENHSYVFSTGRVLPRYENLKPAPAIPTIGTFGFSVGTKGYQRLVSAVEQEFDRAIIRINIPANGIIDQQARDARRQAELCRERLSKPGIDLQITHDFMDDAQLLDFLASNTLNAFLYDYVERGGISSSPDHAMIARRPIAVSRSVMFRHLRGLEPSVTYEDLGLKAIIDNGIRPFQHLLEDWSPDKIRSRYEAILGQVLARGVEEETSDTSSFAATSWAQPLNHGEQELTIPERVAQLPGRLARAVWRRANPFMSPESVALARRVQFKALVLTGALKPKTQFNRILDNRARLEYADVLAEVEKLAPEVVAKKIRAANIQQAFVFDTVRHFAQRLSNPRLLCVGSFEDSASISLKASGFAVEEIDPVVNKMSLDDYFNLPTTKPGTFDVVFSTSVLEHVKEDAKFMRQAADLLAPGGVGVITCDFKEGYQPGDPVIKGDFRFYTKADLSQRILGSLKGCELVDTPQWNCAYPDFELGGFNYTFGTVVFRKR